MKPAKPGAPKRLAAAPASDRALRQRDLVAKLAKDRWHYYVDVVRKRMHPAILQRESASEIVQSALRTALRRIEKGEVRAQESPQMEAFLRVVLENRCATKADRHGALRRSYLRDQGADALDRVLVHQSEGWLLVFANEVGSRIRRLPEDLGAAVTLDLNGFTNDEIAEQLKVSRAGAKRRLAFALRALRLSMGCCPNRSCRASFGPEQECCEACTDDATQKERQMARRLAP